MNEQTYHILSIICSKLQLKRSRNQWSISLKKEEMDKLITLLLEKLCEGPAKEPDPVLEDVNSLNNHEGH